MKLRPKLLEQLVADFKGGINTQSSELTLSQDQVREAINCILRTDGALEKRGGNAVKNTFPEVPTHIEGNVVLSDARYVIVSTPSNVYAMNTIDGTPTSILSGAGLIYNSMAQMNNFLFMVDGVNDNKKWDGTTVTNVGIEAPTTAPTLTASSGGVLTGTYKYAVTFYRGGAYPTESNPSPIAEISLDGENCVLSDIPVSSDPQVTARRIYRTTADGAGLYLIHTINDNTTTSWTDNLDDTNLNTAIEISYERTPFPKCKRIAVAGGRLWGIRADKDEVVFSGLLRPEEWRYISEVDYDALRPNPNDGQAITQIASFKHYLLVFKENSTFVVDTNSYPPTMWKLSGEVGCTIPESVATTPFGIFWANSFGIYLWDGSKLYYASKNIENYYQTILDHSDYSNWHAVYDSINRTYILSAKTKENPAKHVWLVLDVYKLRLDSEKNLVNGWTLFETNLQPVTSFSKYVDDDNNERVVWTSESGKLYLYDEGYTDEGNAYTMRVTTRWITLGSPMIRKVIRRVYPIVKVPDKSTILIKAYYSFSTGGKIVPANLKPASLWDVALWDNVYVWDATGTQFPRVDTNLTTHIVSFSIEHSEPIYFKLIGIGIRYLPKGFDRGV